MGSLREKTKINKTAQPTDTIPSPFFPFLLWPPHQLEGGHEAEPCGSGLGALLTKGEQTQELPEVTKNCASNPPLGVEAEDASSGEGTKMTLLRTMVGGLTSTEHM